MIQSSSEISDIFFDCLDTLSENPWLYATQENCFQGKRKISFSDAILSTICMQKSSSKSEVLKFFAYQEDAPSHSALIQQRSKLDPSAFEDLFHWFTDRVT